MFDGIKKWWYGPDEKVQNVSEELDVYNEDDDGYYDVGQEKTNINNKINYVVSDEIKRDIVKGFYLNKVEIKRDIGEIFEYCVSRGIERGTDIGISYGLSKDESHKISTYMVWNIILDTLYVMNEYIVSSKNNYESIDKTYKFISASYPPKIAHVVYDKYDSEFDNRVLAIHHIARGIFYESAAGVFRIIEICNNNPDKIASQINKHFHDLNVHFGFSLGTHRYLYKKFAYRC